MFFGGCAYLKTRSFEKAKQNVEEKFWITYNIAKYYWPCANFVCYQFACSHMRQPMVDGFAFLYSIVMSYINNNKVETIMALEEEIQCHPQDLLI